MIFRIIDKSDGYLFACEYLSANAALKDIQSWIVGGYPDGDKNLGVAAFSGAEK